MTGALEEHFHPVSFVPRSRNNTDISSRCHGRIVLVFVYFCSADVASCFESPTDKRSALCLGLSHLTTILVSQFSMAQHNMSNPPIRVDSVSVSQGPQVSPQSNYHPSYHPIHVRGQGPYPPGNRVYYSPGMGPQHVGGPPQGMGSVSVLCPCFFSLSISYFSLSTHLSSTNHAAAPSHENWSAGSLSTGRHRAGRTGRSNAANCGAAWLSVSDSVGNNCNATAPSSR